MRVAVAAEGDRVSEHFGHTVEFVIAEVSNGEIKSQTVVKSPEHVPGRFPQFLKEQGVDAVITCSMGQRAQTIFQHFGIKVILGVTGEADEVLRLFAEGTLTSGANNCSRDHEHEHHHDHGGHHHGQSDQNSTPAEEAETNG